MTYSPITRTGSWRQIDRMDSWIMDFQFTHPEPKWALVEFPLVILFAYALAVLFIASLIESLFRTIFAH